MEIGRGEIKIAPGPAGVIRLSAFCALATGGALSASLPARVAPFELKADDVKPALNKNAAPAAIMARQQFFLTCQFIPKRFPIITPVETKSQRSQNALGKKPVATPPMPGCVQSVGCDLYRAPPPCAQYARWTPVRVRRACRTVSTVPVRAFSAAQD
jgi:hypothetical protein